jgi:hypothetical protein
VAAQRLVLCANAHTRWRRPQPALQALPAHDPPRAARDLLVGDSLWSNLASVALGLAVMIFFRLAGVPLLGALPSG